MPHSTAFAGLGNGSVDLPAFSEQSRILYRNFTCLGFGVESDQDQRAFGKKGYTPQNLDKKGDRAFRRRRRPCSPSNRLQITIYSVCRAPWAPPNHPEFFFFFFFPSVLRVNE